MKVIGIDLTQVDSRYLGGVTTYALGITSSMLLNNESDVIVFATKNNIDFLSRNLPKCRFIIIKMKFKLLDQLLRHVNYRMFNSVKIHKIINRIFHYGFRQKIERNIDLLYTPTNYTKYFQCKVPQIVSLHDIQEKTFPRNFSRTVLNYRHMNVLTTLEFSKSIQVSSSFVMKDIIKFYPHAEKNSFIVLREGVNLNYYLASQSLSAKNRKDQVIFPAHHWPHKNHNLLLDAIAQSSILKEFLFIFTGPEVHFTKKLKKKIQCHKLNNVIFTGLISQSELREKYQESLAVISCSRFESSSLPILEGLASGCHAIASDIPAHQEMSKSLNISLFRDNDINSLTSTLEIFLLEIKAGLQIGKGTSNLAVFEWNSVGREFESIILEQIL